MTTVLDFRIVSFDSADYHQMVAVREAILRKPLGRVFKPEELASDVKYVHLAGFGETGNVLATTLLQTISPQEVRFRQVAVAEGYQGKGIGRKLMEFAEAESRKQGFSEVILYARDNAVPFYERIGYTVEGEFAEEVGVPHIWMRKEL